AFSPFESSHDQAFDPVRQIDKRVAGAREQGIRVRIGDRVKKKRQLLWLRLVEEANRLRDGRESVLAIRLPARQWFKGNHLTCLDRGLEQARPELVIVLNS